MVLYLPLLCNKQMKVMNHQMFGQKQKARLSVIWHSKTPKILHETPSTPYLLVSLQIEPSIQGKERGCNGYPYCGRTPPKCSGFLLFHTVHYKGDSSIVYALANSFHLTRTSNIRLTDSPSYSSVSSTSVKRNS